MPSASRPDRPSRRLKSALLLRAQGLLARAGLVTAPRGRRGHAVVLASNGDANIGDVALFEAFVSSVGGPVLAIARDPASYPLRGPVAADVEFAATDIVWGGRIARARSFVRLGRALRGAASFTVLGADNMDGGYGDHFAVTEWATAIVARRLGVPSRIAGFSWSGAASPAAIAALGKATRAGVALYPRDGVSAGRLPDAAREVAVSTADLAFLLGEPREASRWQERLAAARARGQGVCLLNVSALIAARVDLRQDYRRIVDGLIRAGRHVVVVPHVGGRGNDDRVAAQTALGTAWSPRDVTVVDEILPPLAIKALAHDADLVVTGRMHLSVLALSVGTPAIAFATHGKVEGLFAHFGLEGFALDPRPDIADRVLAIALDETALRAAREAIAAALPRVRRLAAANLAGLPRRLAVSPPVEAGVAS